MSPDVLGELLKGQPPGKQMWLAVRGRSMRPVLRGGESLKVERCSEDSLKPGEIAVMLRPDGSLVSHLVVATAPLRTESFDGKADPPGLEVLARALAVRRGQRVLPLYPAVRPALRAAQKLWSWATRATIPRAAYSLAGAAIASERTARLRELLGFIEVERLAPAALGEFSVALSRWVTLDGLTLEHLGRDGTLVGARRAGKLVGVAAVFPDGVLRHPWLQRRAQGMGVEERLAGLLVQLANPTRAEVDVSQPRFAAALEGHGFRFQSKVGRLLLLSR